MCSTLAVVRRMMYPPNLSEEPIYETKGWLMTHMGLNIGHV